MSWEPLPPADTTDVQGVKLAKVLDGAPFTEDVLDGLFGGGLSEGHPVATQTAAEVHDDFATAPLGDFISRVADSGQAYNISGDTTPKIEVVNGYRVLSIANATTAGIHATYLEQSLSANCRYAFAQVMYGSVGSTDDSSVALASPKTSISTTPDPLYDIGAHLVVSASGGLAAQNYVDMVPQATSDLNGEDLFGSGPTPTPNVPLWTGWVLCENGTLLILTPAGVLTGRRDSRYIINGGPYAWVEPYLTAGDTDVRPYVLKWYAGTSVSEAQAALNHIDDLKRILSAADTAQSTLGSDNRGNKFADVATVANTTETDLHAYAVSGGTLAANGDQINVKFSGLTAANGNTKRLRVYFGTTVIFDSTAVAFNAAHWEIEATIIRVSATTCRVTAKGLFGTNVSLVTYTAATETLANSLALKLTGTNGTSNAGDITAKLSTWQKIHAA
jgi:hypothetical protein